MAGFACAGIWPGAGGIIVSALFAIGNVPYIIIQRSNRPRLARILAGLERKNTERRQTCARFNPKLRHRRRA